jgi:hypothetical protein
MRARSSAKAIAIAAGQMSLPLHAQRTKELDGKQRRVVLVVLARLLLEATGAFVRREGDDDAA